MGAERWLWRRDVYLVDQQVWISKDELLRVREVGRHRRGMLICRAVVKSAMDSRATDLRLFLVS